MTPRLLDLFCGAGGAATGYHRAGFEVVGIDIKPQPRYPFAFVQLDALDALDALLPDGQGGSWTLADFDAIHASPPCQASANVTSWRGNKADHPELIPQTRELLEATGLPWVIENVPEAAIRRDFLLCGTMFGLAVKRHRAFETNWRGFALNHGCGSHYSLLPFEHKRERAYADAMGCTWMNKTEARQAIPPAYTEHIGGYLLAEVKRRARIAA